MTVAARQESWRIVTSDGASAIDLQPLQGLWTEAQYLRLTDGGRRPIEFTDGHIEILSMPTDRHQVIVRHLFMTLFPRAAGLGGTVLFAPLRVLWMAEATPPAQALGAPQATVPALLPVELADENAGCVFRPLPAGRSKRSGGSASRWVRPGTGCP